MISRVLTRFSGINKFKITQPQEILLLPKVELMEIFWLEGIIGDKLVKAVCLPD
jgi:hypothetical protein